MKITNTTCNLIPIVVLCTAACSDDAPHKPPDASDAAAYEEADPSRRTDGSAPPVAPPAREQVGLACVFSADCPSGLHCDLGECVQRCNEETPCSSGATCSARGRCLSAGEADLDPDPTGRHAGSIETDRTFHSLTDSDLTLSIPLRSDSPDPVRYRVELNAPYLRIAEPRGEFTGETDLQLEVDTAGLEGGSLPGSVRIFTSLGEVIVETPMRVGLSGTYRGTMVYDGAGLRLGSAQIVVDLFEHWGEVTVQVDSDKSLLFPRAPAGSGDPKAAVTGRGVFALSDGVSFTLRQVFDEALGGERNHFGRPLGRELRFDLDTATSGALEGTFEDKVYGILEQPVTLTGSVHLQHGPLQTEGRAEASADVPLPGAGSGEPLMPEAYFPGWGLAECLHVIAAAQAGGGEEPRTLADVARSVDRMYHGPLEATLASPSLGSSQSFEDLADVCEAELERAPSAAPVECALVPALACVLSGLVNQEQTSRAAASAFSDLYAHSLDPALFVAQDHLVRGVSASFSQGTTGHELELEAARAVLAPVTRWALAPEVLEYLRRTARRSSREGAAPPHHRAFEVLARLFYVLTTIDGESARIAVADRTQTVEERLQETQERGVLALFEAATLAGVLSAWGDDAPAGAGTEFLDVLTPIDQGFTAAIEGALVFGVPEGFVPFVYDPRASKPTNVEQVFDSILSKLEQQAADETAFVNARREFEANAETLARELEQVRAGNDEQIASICGSSFEVDLAEPDWEACGADGSGEVAALKLDVDLAAERLVAAESRIRGLADKIEIETRRVEDVYDVRQGTIAFIDSAGEQFEQMIWAEGVINAIQKMIEVSSNSSLFNLGAPAGMGIAAAAVEMERTQIHAARQRLQTAQEIRIHGDNADVEVINGMAVIKALMVDMAQLQVEMQQELIGQLQVNVSLGNALDRARRLHDERQRVLHRVENGSLSDPTFRLVTNRAALQAMRSRADAQRGLYVAGRALEYHLNQPFGDALPGAVLNAYNAAELDRLGNCLESVLADSRLQLRVPQEYSTEISVREQLGIIGPVFDAVTGRTLTEGEQFRYILLQNQNLDGLGGVGIGFSSNLDPGNGIWPSAVCDDRVASVEAQLVGDFLGDGEALVELRLEGGGVLRRCDGDALVNWSTTGSAAIQAGVNTFGTAPTPNGSLHGLSVASSQWRLLVPGPAEAPANADVNLLKLEDIVLRVRHQARPESAGRTPMTLTCLSNVGNGG